LRTIPDEKFDAFIRVDGLEYLNFINVIQNPEKNELKLLVLSQEIVAVKRILQGK
jgi:hypothetical protein